MTLFPNSCCRIIMNINLFSFFIESHSCENLCPSISKQCHGQFFVHFSYLFFCERFFCNYYYYIWTYLLKVHFLFNLHFQKGIFIFQLLFICFLLKNISNILLVKKAELKSLFFSFEKKCLFCLWLVNRRKFTVRMNQICFLCIHIHFDKKMYIYLW